MKFAVLYLPRYLHLKQAILRQFGETNHEFVVVEEGGREMIDGGLEALRQWPNVRLVLAEDTAPDAMVRLAREHGVDQVVSFSDRGMVAAAVVRQALGMPGNDVRTEEWVVDKGLMRRRLHECGLTRIRFAVTTLARLADECRRQPLPVIVKPTSLGASLCVELVETAGALPAYLARCRANRVFDGGELIVEEYVPGPEVSVEGIIVAGEIHFLGVTESHTSGKPYFVGTGHDFFPDHPEAPALYAFVTRVVRCLRMDHCPFHIELKRGAEGFEVIEVHTRFAGAMIMELVREGTGVPAFSTYIGTLAGEPVHRPAAVEPLVYSEAMLCTGAGVVREIGLDPAVAGDERVMSYALDYAPGQTIAADVVAVEYAGYVAFRSRGLDEADSFRAAIARGFTIATEPAA